MIEEVLEFQSKGAIFAIFTFAPLVLLFFSHLIFKKIYGKDNLTDDDQTFLTNTLTGLITLACISIGFSYSIAIQNQNQADSDLVNEAIYIQSLDRFLIIEGSTPAMQARRYLQQYAGSIVDDEWQEMQNGSASPITTGFANKFEEQIEKINPITQKQASIFSAIISNSEKVKSARMQRILNSTLSIPPLFIKLNNLLVLLIIVVSGSLMVSASKTRTFALTVQCLIFSLFLSGILILDYPYTGVDSITPNSIISVLKVI